MLNRRQLLETSAVIAISAAMPREADAISSDVGNASAFNGHKLQGDVTSSSYPFMNLLKTGSWWKGNNNTPYDPQYFTDDGYPTSLPKGQAGTQFTCPTATERPGNYVLITDGSGSINIQDLNGKVLFSGSVSGTGTQKSFAHTNNTGIMKLYITSVGSPPISSIRVCHVDDVNDVLAGKIFQHKYTDLIGKFGVLRFMSVQNTNVTNVVKWSDVRPDTYFNYGGGDDSGWFPSRCYAGTAQQAGGGGQNNFHYTITSSKINGGAAYTPSNNDRIICNFSAASGQKGLQPTAIDKSNPCKIHFARGANTQFVTGTHLYIGGINNSGGFTDLLSWITMPVTDYGSDGSTDWVTIAVDTTGARGTFSPGVTVYAMCTLSINGGPAIIMSPVGSTRFCSLIYASDPQTPNGYIKGGWGISADGEITGIKGGWPISVCVALTNVTGAHPWFCIPHQAADGSPNYIQTIPDYVTQLATYCKTHLDPTLIPRFEISNEVWNNSFGQTNYGWVKGWCRDLYVNTLPGSIDRFPGYQGFIYDYRNWYGQAVSIVGQAISAVYGNDKTKYQMICAFQTASTGGTNCWRLGIGTNGAPHSGQLPPYWYLVKNVSGSSGADAQMAYQWTTHVASSSYWQSGYAGTAYEVILAAAWKGGDLTTLDTYMAAGGAIISNAADNITFVGPNPAADPIVGTNVTFHRVTAGLSLSGTIQACYVYDDTVWIKGTIVSYSGTTLVLTVTSCSYTTTGTYGGSAQGNGLWSVPAFNGHGTFIPFTSNGTVDTLNRVLYPYWYNLARSLTNNSGQLLKYCVYEGGYDPEPGNTGQPGYTQACTDFRRAAKFSSLITALSQTNDNNFIGQGPGAEFPCEFSFAGGGYNPIWDPDIYTTPTPPRWLNIINNFQ